jgi:hypothetical protein
MSINKILIKHFAFRYLSIKPPDYLPNAPRSIFQWKLWKANEFLNFIIYYSLVVFHGYMNSNHYEHLTKLVISLQKLLSKKITVDDLPYIRECLKEFVKEKADLYHESIMKSGTHELLHIVDMILETAPINVICCFQFEELNRKFLRYIKGFIDE